MSNNHLDRLFANDAYEVVDDSDQEGAESSDDDVDIILHGTMEQIKRMQRRNLGRESSSEEDEFEKEMTSELNETMKSIEDNRSAPTATSALPEPGTETTAPTPSFYDNCYFDSDSDDEGTSEEKKGKQRRVLTNDELFYDPEMDDKDQKWIDDKRLAYQPKRTASSTATKSTTPGKPRPLPTSDAVLNCPGCMCLLCLDCQRHATYTHQYRAMFVTNCAPDMTEILQHSAAKQIKQKKSKKRKWMENGGAEESAEPDAKDTESGSSVDELYHPVRCDLCRTEVAVYDRDEVYHFYNVLASY